MPLEPESSKSFQPKQVGLRSARREAGKHRHQRWECWALLPGKTFRLPRPQSMAFVTCKADNSPTFQEERWEQRCLGFTDRDA